MWKRKHANLSTNTPRHGTQHREQYRKRRDEHRLCHRRGRDKSDARRHGCFLDDESNGTPATADGKLPAPVPGSPDAYTKLPPSFKSVPMLPGKGGKVSSFHQTFGQMIPGRSDNLFWQELEKRLGLTMLDATIVNAASYAEKLAAVTAAGTLPDLTQVALGTAPDQYKVIQQGAYTDLTAYVTGDALKEFPNLAAIPAQIWKNATFKGKVYGVPRPQLLTSGWTALRKDWADKLGLSATPKSLDEWQNLMVSFTKGDPDGNGNPDSWGFSAASSDVFNLGIVMNFFRVPNTWRMNTDGSLTYYIETDEFKQAVAFTRKLVEAGAAYPDTPSLTAAQRTQLFVAGKYGSVPLGIGGFGGAAGIDGLTRAVNPKAEVVGVVPFGADGGKGNVWNSNGIFSLTCIPAQVGKDRERVKELLRILNFFAAPFGSEEYLFINYGIEGVHHMRSADGTPVLTDRGKMEIVPNNGLASLIIPYPSLYFPGFPNDPPKVQRFVADLVPLGVDNPVQNVYSPTATTKAGELDQLRQDRLIGILTGRDPLTSLDQYVKDWRARGGDQIRKELQDGSRNG